MNWKMLAELFQIILSVVLVILCIIQSKGQGISSTLSGSFSFYRSRRGVEKFLFILTIVLGISLIFNSLFLIII